MSQRFEMKETRGADWKGMRHSRAQQQKCLMAGRGTQPAGMGSGNRLPCLEQQGPQPRASQTFLCVQLCKALRFMVLTMAHSLCLQLQLLSENKGWAVMHLFPQTHLILLIYFSSTRADDAAAASTQGSRAQPARAAGEN